MIKRYATIQLFPPTSKKYVSTFFNGHQQPQSASFLFGVQEPFGAKPGSPSPQAARPIDVLLPLREEKSSEESMGKFTHTHIYIYTHMSFTYIHEWRCAQLFFWFLDLVQKDMGKSPTKWWYTICFMQFRREMISRCFRSMCLDVYPRKKAALRFTWPCHGHKWLVFHHQITRIALLIDMNNIYSIHIEYHLDSLPMPQKSKRHPLR